MLSLRFHAIMVDNGVLRLNETQQVNVMLNEDLGVNLTVVDDPCDFPPDAYQNRDVDRFTTVLLHMLKCKQLFNPH